MLIANPIYDVVFRYLLEDLSVAKLMLGVLLNKEIVELDFLPTELTVRKPESVELPAEALTEQRTRITVFRIDFSAKIKDADGKITQVVIELQKARLFNNIKRFRGYLGKQYSNPSLLNTIVSTTGVKYAAGIPIYAIYFLGYPLDHYENVPILTIQNLVSDRFTRQVLDMSEPFISSLFHEGMIINIPALGQGKRDKVERMLSIFEQPNELGMHLLELDSNSYPVELHPIIHRLLAAAASPEMQDYLDAEDEAFSNLAELEKQLLEKESRIDAAERKAKEATQSIERIVRNAHARGMSDAEIAELCGLDLEDVRKYLAK